MSPIVITKRKVRSGDPAADLAWQIEQGLKLICEREVIFAQPRKWRFDLVIGRRLDAGWLDEAPKIAIEIEGGLFMKGTGRHNRGAGMRNDIEKYNEAVLRGWRVLRVLPEWVQSGQAFTLVARAVHGTP